MRVVVGVLAYLTVGGASVAVADPPATPTAPPAAQAPAATPAASPSAPATPAKDTPSSNVVIQSTAEIDSLEKHFVAEGYKMEMHHGEKYFCRREEELGTRLGGKKICGTASELAASERESQNAARQGHQYQNNPSGK